MARVAICLAIVFAASVGFGAELCPVFQYGKPVADYEKAWNGHIAVTGSSADLTILDFTGKVLAQIKKAISQRNLAVQFSPLGDLVLIGSWDNTIRVFAIKE